MEMLAVVQVHSKKINGGIYASQEADFESLTGSITICPIALRLAAAALRRKRALSKYNQREATK
jgi:hypothetical protein